MNLTRGSLYKAFKDKKSLFLLVLAKYDDQAVTGAVALLTKPDRDGWERIFAIFESIVDTVKTGDRRGCLLCSAIAGPATYDRDIAAFARKSLERMRAAFQQAVLESQRPDDAEGMAHFLVSQYVGLRIMSRTDVSTATVKQNVTALRNLVEARQFAG